MRFLIDDVFPEGLARRTDLAKTRIFLAIGEKNAGHSHTRSSLAPILSLRPATVSAMVAELIEDGLVIEGRKIAPPRKGRPEVPLTIETRRILTVVIDIVSRNLKGALIDLGGTVVAETGIALDVEEADQDTILAAFREIVTELIGCAPRGAQLAGIGVALPGIVDSSERRWISAARWPHIAGLDFGALETETGLPVRIEQKRQAELRALLHGAPKERAGGVLLVNWGYGISSAFAQNGVVLNSAMGGFGDFGHWLVHPESAEKCLCGQTGCLEAHAALWSLLPTIRKSFPDTPINPESLGNFLRTHDLSKIPRVESAIRLFVLALHNLFKCFFPDRIILSGQVLKNLWVAERVRTGFTAIAPAYARDRVILSANDSGCDAVTGVAAPFFIETLRPMMLARNARV